MTYEFIKFIKFIKCLKCLTFHTQTGGPLVLKLEYRIQVLLLH